MASISARWRRVVISISREGSWNSLLFTCRRSPGVGERFTVGYSYCPELSDTVRRGYRLVVSRAALFRYLAGSLVSGALRRDCVRAGRGCDSPNVLGHWWDDSAHRGQRSRDWARAHSMGKLQSYSA